MAAPVFIIIPDIHGDRHYIPPYSIKRVIEGESTVIIFEEGGALKNIEILLTGEEIHERLREIHKEQDQDFFGPFNK